MSETVYFLCAFLSIVCATLLIRGYRKTGSNFLLWSSLCFFFLAGNNIILVVDLVFYPDVEMNGPFWRNLFGAVSGGLLLFGLIWEVTW